MGGTGEGRPSVSNAQLFELLYDELHRRARDHMRGQPKGHTLQTSALINEVFLRLCRNDDGSYRDPDHFLLAASRAMRHVLVDHARAKATAKRGGGRKVPLDDVHVVEFEERALDIEALHVALEKLEGFDPEMAQAVELRFFGGAEMAEVSRLLDIPKRTLERRWSATRAWLYQEVK